MKALVSSASASLREHTQANRQLIDIFAEIRRHGNGVEEAGTRQRAAVAQHVTAAKALIEASNAAREARSPLTACLPHYKNACGRWRRKGPAPQRQSAAADVPGVGERSSQDVDGGPADTGTSHGSGAGGTVRLQRPAPRHEHSSSLPRGIAPRS